MINVLKSLHLGIVTGQLQTQNAYLASRKTGMAFAECIPLWPQNYKIGP